MDKWESAEAFKRRHGNRQHAALELRRPPAPDDGKLREAQHPTNHQGNANALKAMAQECMRPQALVHEPREVPRQAAVQ